LGGAALNTIRILKALGLDATFFGAIGNDKYGDDVEKLLKENAIDAR